MIRDLVERAVHMVRDEQTQVVRAEAERRTEEALLDLLMPPTELDPKVGPEDAEETERRRRSREKFRKQLGAEELEDRLVEITVETKSVPVGIMATIGMDQVDPDVQNFMDRLMPSQPKRRTVPIREARKVIFDEQCDKLIDREKVTEMALTRTENTGIIFLDEIDKLVTTGHAHGPDVSRQGVQRDLLPVIEGCTVPTRYGPVKTDHILFIAAGAFHGSKPGDLIPELQGRLPIRVELADLTQEDFVRILTQPENALTKQQVALLATEGVLLEFADDAIEEMAATAFHVNDAKNNIGARRLMTVMERVIEEISFDAPERRGQTIRIDRAYVRERLADISEDTDLSRFIL
jgi:ATP-dependent HslUV protease ATP-binding subunit HslU